jgi:hypothetical protein
MKSNLSNRVTQYIEEGGNLVQIIEEAIESATDDSLNEIIRLVNSDYGGNTYKRDLKSSAIMCIPFWGEKGIDAIVSMVMKNPSFSNILVSLRFLAHVSREKLKDFPLLIHKEIKNLRVIKQTNVDLKSYARIALIDIIVKCEKNDKYPSSLMTVLNTSIFDDEIMEELFTAFVMRWFHFNSSSIKEYNELISEPVFNEIVYHNYLKDNSFLLEPFYTQIWSKPRFGELFQPDFLIRSNDNKYTVVEIEKPQLPIMTQNGNLSSYATHAKRQALEYRDWVISNNLYVKDKYPEIWRPYSLVIIGLESNLSQKQKERLRQENESTEGRLRIVGFDWIYNRAKSTYNNLIESNFSKRL